MPMAEHSILVGKSYRTPQNEVREVSGMEKGDVVYRPVTTAPGPGEMWAPAKRLPLAQFAAEVESEITEISPSRTKPDRGVVKVRSVTTNQNGDHVQAFIAKLLVFRRAADSEPPL